jgi:hypothetical protein
MTKTYLLMLVMWLSLTSMTTLNACSTHRANKTIATDVAHTDAGQAVTNAVTNGEVVLGAAGTDQYVPLLKGKAHKGASHCIAFHFPKAAYAQLLDILFSSDTKLHTFSNGPHVNRVIFSLHVDQHDAIAFMQQFLSS